MADNPTDIRISLPETAEARDASQAVVRPAVQNAAEARTSPVVPLGLFLFGTVVAAVYAFVIYPRQGAVSAIIDLNGFGKLGRHLANGDGFSLGYGPTLRRGPLYPFFIALLLKIFGNEGTEAQVFRPVLAANCLILGLTCVTAWTLGRKLFGARTGLLAGILCALTPQTLRYVGMAEVETTMGLLIVLMALTGLNLRREPTIANGVWFGLTVGAATLVKPVALFYPFAYALLFWWSSRRAGKLQMSEIQRSASPFAVVPIGAALGVFILCLLPWTIRNMMVTGGQFKGISSNGPGEFLRGYVNAQPKFAFLKQDFGGNEGSTDQWDWQANLYEDAILQQHGMSFFSTEQFGPHGEKRQMEARLSLELQKDAIEGAEVKRRLLHEPVGFLKKFVLQLFMFWYIVETRKKSLIVGGIALVCLALAVLGWRSARRQGIETWPVIATIVYFNLIYAAILAFARYSMPVFPALLVLSAQGLMSFRGERNLPRQFS